MTSTAIDTAKLCLLQSVQWGSRLMFHFASLWQAIDVAKLDWSTAHLLGGVVLGIVWADQLLGESEGGLGACGPAISALTMGPTRGPNAQAGAAHFAGQCSRYDAPRIREIDHLSNTSARVSPSGQAQGNAQQQKGEI